MATGSADRARIGVQPIVFTRKVALWRDLLETIGLPRAFGDDVFSVHGAPYGSVAVHALGESSDILEGTVKLAWTVPDVAAYRADADAAGLSTELTRESFGDELRVDLPGLGMATVTAEAAGADPAVGASASGEDPVGALRVIERVNALDLGETRQNLEALGWSARFWAEDGSYVSMQAGAGLMAVARATRLPSVGQDATAILAVEVDTPRTEYDRLADSGLDLALTEHLWGLSVDIATPSDWVLSLVQPPLDDPAYEYADPVEQASADEVAADS